MTPRTIVVHIEADSEIDWVLLKDRIKVSVNLTKGCVFLDISTATIPNLFSLAEAEDSKRAL